MGDAQAGIRPRIRQLDAAAVNRIAAGEVVERPASAVKELVENALDAGARRIAVDFADGGIALIRVADDGHGMAPEDLPLAVARHATSKIDGSDLLDIRSFGFRGEALPSLGAVGRLTITSRAAGTEGARLTVAAGVPGEVLPAAAARGTVVELRDLFHATPARLKFLRSERAEAQAITDVVRRLALAAPGVGFALRDLGEGGDGEGGDGRTLLRADPDPSPEARVRRLLGPAFADNALPVAALREGFVLTGLAALPTHARGAAVAQFVFVNGRPVRDRMLLSALRAGYGDLIPRDRHPAAVLWLVCDPRQVDVNVHPAKAEVRFRDPGLVRGLVVGALRQALAEAGHRTASTLAEGALGAARPMPGWPPPGAPAGPRGAWGPPPPPRPGAGALAEAFRAMAPGLGEDAAPFAAPGPAAPGGGPADAVAPAACQPLGRARAQLFGTWIVAEAVDGLVLVDAHAAHERIVYERLKAQAAANGVAVQTLLVPEIVECGAADAARLLDHAGELAALGLVVEAFGGTAVAVRGVPAILGAASVAPLLADIADELADLGSSERLSARIDAVLARMACHGSVRGGRALRIEEMDALLRAMETTPNAGQCNHGRPTSITLRRSDIERLFGRR